MRFEGVPRENIIDSASRQGRPPIARQFIGGDLWADVMGGETGRERETRTPVALWPPA